MPNPLAWGAAHSSWFAFVSAWFILAVCLDASARYAGTILHATHTPDPFSVDSLLSSPSDATSATKSDSDPHGIIAATKFVRSNFQSAQFMPSMTMPLLVIVTPRACDETRGAEQQQSCINISSSSSSSSGENLDQIFLSDFKSTLWWAALELCIAANNVSAVVVSPIGMPTIAQHFPKLIASDNKSVNAFIWLQSTTSSSSSLSDSSAAAAAAAASTDNSPTSPDSSAGTAGSSSDFASTASGGDAKFNQHTQLRKVVRRCFDYINSSQPAYIEKIETHHVYEALSATRASVIMRWPCCIIIMALVLVVFASIPAARTLVRTETKTVFVSLLRSRGRDVSRGTTSSSDILPPRQNGSGGGGGRPLDDNNSNLSPASIASNVMTMMESQWSDALILDIACGRSTPRFAIESLMRHFSSRAMSGFDYQQQPYVVPVSSSSPTIQQQQQQQHISFRPSVFRQLAIHFFCHLWFVGAAAAIPFCVIMSGVRLCVIIRGTTDADQRQMSSPLFFPALLLTSFLPLCVVHVLICGRVVDSFFVRDTHADFATFLKQELVWARMWFTPDGWWLAASPASDNNAALSPTAGNGTAAAAAAAVAGRAKSKMWSIFAMFSGGSDDATSPSLLSPNDRHLGQQVSNNNNNNSAGSVHGSVSSVPSRFKAKTGNNSNTKKAEHGEHDVDDEDDSVANGYGTVAASSSNNNKQQKQQQQRAGGNDEGDDEDDDDEDDDNSSDNSSSTSLTCGERCLVITAPFITAIILPVLISLRAFLHSPIIHAEKASRRFLAPILISFFLIQCAVGSVLIAEGTFSLVGAVSVVAAASMIVSIGALLPALSAASLGSLTILAAWHSEARRDPACSPARQARPRFEHSSCVHATFCAYQREEEENRQRAAAEEEEEQRLLQRLRGEAGLQPYHHPPDSLKHGCCKQLANCLSACWNCIPNLTTSLSQNRGKKQSLRLTRWFILTLLVLVPFSLSIWFFVRLRLDACGWEQFLPASRETLRDALVKDGRSSMMLPFTSVFATLANDGVWQEPFFLALAASHSSVSSDMVASILSANGINASSATPPPPMMPAAFKNTVLWDVSRNNVQDTTYSALQGLVKALNPFDPAYQNLVKRTVNTASSAALSITVPPFDPLGSVADGAIFGSLDHENFVRLVNAGIGAAGGVYLPAFPTDAGVTTLPKGANFLAGVISGTTPFIVALAGMRACVAKFWPILAGSVAFTMFMMWSRVDFRIVSVLRHKALRKRLTRESSTLSGARNRKKRKNRKAKNAAKNATDNDSCDGGSGGGGTDCGTSVDGDAATATDDTSASTFALPDDDDQETDASDLESDAGKRQQNDRNNNYNNGRRQQHQQEQRQYDESEDTAAGQAFVARMKTTFLVVLCLFVNTGLASTAGLAAASLHASLYTPGCACRELQSPSSNASGSAASSSSPAGSSGDMLLPRLSWQLVRAAFFPGIALLFFALECCDLWSYIMLPFQNRPIDVDKLLQLVAQHAQARIDAASGAGNTNAISSTLDDGNGPAALAAAQTSAYASSGFTGTYQQYLRLASEHQQQQRNAAAAATSPSSLVSPRNPINASFASSADSRYSTSGAGGGGGGSSAAGGGTGAASATSIAGRSAAVDACGSNSLEHIGYICAAAVLVSSLVILVASRVRGSSSCADDVPVVTQFWISAAVAAGWKLFVINALVHAAQRHWLLNLSLF